MSVNKRIIVFLCYNSSNSSDEEDRNGSSEAEENIIQHVAMRGVFDGVARRDCGRRVTLKVLFSFRVHFLAILDGLTRQG